ncbi:type II secretion system protein J [Thermomonas fusca]
MRRQAAGFTLMEVLLATSLLAAALALGFGILRAAGATVARGEAMAERNERIRVVSQFLRQRIGGAQAIAFGFDAGSGQALRFAGDAHSMHFVAEQPAYLGRGGPQLHALQARAAGQAQRLEVGFQLLRAGVALPASRPPEPLADGLADVEFAYRALAADGRVGPWERAWTTPQALPMQVRVRIRDARGAWPDMVVALPLAGAGMEARR